MWRPDWVVARLSGGQTEMAIFLDSATSSFEARAFLHSPSLCDGSHWTPIALVGCTIYLLWFSTSYLMSSPTHSKNGDKLHSVDIKWNSVPQGLSTDPVWQCRCSLCVLQYCPSLMGWVSPRWWGCVLFLGSCHFWSIPVDPVYLGSLPSF